jgi:hypothetical protein
MDAIVYLQELAQKYNDSQRFGTLTPTDAPFNAGLATRIAAAYDKLYDTNPQFTSLCYRAMEREVVDQYTFLVEHDVTFEFTLEDPYTSAEDMHESYCLLGELRVYTGGDNHPLLSHSVNRVSGLPTINDMFRAIHDIFGHLARGNDFSAEGEERAWASHCQMFTKLAGMAMTTETRGQSSWYYYGPTPGHFPPQKAAILPVFCQQ